MEKCVSLSFPFFLSSVAENILIAFENTIRLSADFLIVSADAIRKPASGIRMFSEK